MCWLSDLVSIDLSIHVPNHRISWLRKKCTAALRLPISSWTILQGHFFTGYSGYVAPDQRTRPQSKSHLVEDKAQVPGEGGEGDDTGKDNLN
jgi:hypothetical protein